MEKIFLDGINDYKLSLAIFDAPKPKAVIQVIHGMQEHKERYYDFAEFLALSGYAVVVSDMRGHGEDAPMLGHIADKKGRDLLIDDQRRIYEFVKGRYENLPVYLFGHSMGSIISRVLLQTDSKKYDKVALSGYVAPNPISWLAVGIGNIEKALTGKKRKSNFLASLALGPYTKAIKDRKTDLDWLSYNEENVKNYYADPLCGIPFTNGSFDALFHCLNDMGKAKKYIDVKSNLPILLIGGKEDPCVGGEKGSEKSQKVLRDAGFKEISLISYQKMRHEILNEVEHQRVYDDLLAFFNR